MKNDSISVDSMTTTPLYFRWDLIATYVGFKFLQGGGTGGMGALNNLRSFLWVRIQQYTTREVEVSIQEDCCKFLILGKVSKILHCKIKINCVYVSVFLLYN